VVTEVGDGPAGFANGPVLGLDTAGEPVEDRGVTGEGDRVAGAAALPSGAETGRVGGA